VSITLLSDHDDYPCPCHRAVGVVTAGDVPSTECGSTVRECSRSSAGDQPTTSTIVADSKIATNTNSNFGCLADLLCRHCSKLREAGSHAIILSNRKAAGYATWIPRHDAAPEPASHSMRVEENVVPPPSFSVPTAAGATATSPAPVPGNAPEATHAVGHLTSFGRRRPLSPNITRPKHAKAMRSSAYNKITPRSLERLVNGNEEPEERPCAPR